MYREEYTKSKEEWNSYLNQIITETISRFENNKVINGQNSSSNLQENEIDGDNNINDIEETNKSKWLYLEYQLAVEKERNYINMKLLNQKIIELEYKNSMLDRLKENFNEILDENKLLSEYKQETEILVNRLSKENFDLQLELRTSKFTIEEDDKVVSSGNLSPKSPHFK